MSLCLCVRVSLWCWVAAFLCCLCFSLCLCVSVSLCLCILVSLCLYVSLCEFLLLWVFVSQCISVSVSQCLSVSVSQCLCICVSVSFLCSSFIYDSFHLSAFLSLNHRCLFDSVSEASFFVTVSFHVFHHLSVSATVSFLCLRVSLLLCVPLYNFHLCLSRFCLLLAFLSYLSVLLSFRSTLFWLCWSILKQKSPLFDRGLVLAFWFQTSLMSKRAVAIFGNWNKDSKDEYVCSWFGVIWSEMEQLFVLYQ